MLLRSRSVFAGVVAALGCAASCDAPREASPAAVVRTEAEAPKAALRADVPVAPARQRTVVPVAAGPESLDELSRAQQQRYRAAVAEGRRLHHGGDYEGAVSAFGRALDVMPNDPRIISEQGWAAFFAGQLKDADRLLQRAEAAAGDDERLRASILYNLGRVAEAEQRTADAIDAYQHSLRLRPHPSAYRHLIGLDGGTRYRFGPTVAPTQGPYKRLSELCAQERRISAVEREHEPSPLDAAADSAEGFDGFACITNAADGSVAAAVRVPPRRKRSAPWKDLRFVEVRTNAFQVRMHAALRTEDGWFVLPDVAAWVRNTPGTQEGATVLEASIGAPRTSGGGLVFFDVETKTVELEDGAQTYVELHRVEFICGVGPSGQPSCTGALPRSGSLQEAGATTADWIVERTVSAEGSLVLKGEPTVLDEPVAALLGTHALVFP